MNRKKRANKKNWMKENYRLCWKYLKESRRYVIFAALLFAASAIFGFFFPVFFVDYINKFISQILSQLSGKNFFEITSFIILNNLTSSFFAMILGILFLIPVFVGFFNGYVLGFVAAKSVGVGGLLVLWKLLPHGIFELPALIISLSVGMRFGVEIFTKKRFFYNFENIFRIFIFIIVPLLVLAGIIEGSLIFLLR